MTRLCYCRVRRRHFARCRFPDSDRRKCARAVFACNRGVVPQQLCRPEPNDPLPQERDDGWWIAPDRRVWRGGPQHRQPQRKGRCAESVMKPRVGLLATLGSFPAFSGPTAYTIGPDTCPNFEGGHSSVCQPGAIISRKDMSISMSPQRPNRDNAAPPRNCARSNMVNVQGSQDRLGVERHYDRGFHRGDGWVEARLEYSAFLIHRHLRITVRLHSSPRTPRPSPVSTPCAQTGPYRRRCSGAGFIDARERRPEQLRQRQQSVRPNWVVQSLRRSHR